MQKLHIRIDILTTEPYEIIIIIIIIIIKVGSLQPRSADPQQLNKPKTEISSANASLTTVQGEKGKQVVEVTKTANSTVKIEGEEYGTLFLLLCC